MAWRRRCCGRQSPATEMDYVIHAAPQPRLDGQKPDEEQPLRLVDLVFDRKRTLIGQIFPVSPFCLSLLPSEPKSTSRSPVPLPPLPSNSSETRPMVGAAPRIFKPWDSHVVAASCTLSQHPTSSVETRSLVLASAELADRFSHSRDWQSADDWQKKATPSTEGDLLISFHEMCASP